MNNDWKMVCLKCGEETTYTEINENGGCPNCGGGDFQVVIAEPTDDQPREPQKAS